MWELIVRTQLFILFNLSPVDRKLIARHYGKLYGEDKKCSKRVLKIFIQKKMILMIMLIGF